MKTSLDEKNLGDIQKFYEEREAKRSITPKLAVIARLDGRAFHRLCEGLNFPFDGGMTCAMQKTAQSLLDEFRPAIVYTQSDEITMVWRPDQVDHNFQFNGRFQKLTSLFAAYASVRFNSWKEYYIPKLENRIGTFDCRVWQVPDIMLATDNLLWREMDATKNSISMAAHKFFKQSEIEGKNSKERVRMLEEIKGVRWGNYPISFKRGTYYVHKQELRSLTPEGLLRIPEAHRPTGPVERRVIKQLEIPPATTIANLMEVYFFEGEPELIKNESTDSL